MSEHALYINNKFKSNIKKGIFFLEFYQHKLIFADEYESTMRNQLTSIVHKKQKNPLMRDFLNWIWEFLQQLFESRVWYFWIHANYEIYTKNLHQVWKHLFNRYVLHEFIILFFTFHWECEHSRELLYGWNRVWMYFSTCIFINMQQRLLFVMESFVNNVIIFIWVHSIQTASSD